ncbi:hypothetical protein ACLI1A_10290 [Flavobacterium sp. RHBU_3]|uniref:hypothetical protein n=1 Tax=Flavobacterium sp. RHBU_3 TaxID=3391184 RepID=UPI0039853013
MEADNLSLKQIANLNSRSERWKVQDFLNCYVNLGSEDYKTLQRFTLRFPINIMTAVDLLMFNNPKVGGGHDSKEIFESGDFNVKYLTEATHLANVAKDIFGAYSFSHDRYLLQALQVLQEKELCDFERLKQKLSAVPTMMVKQTDKKKYLGNIEQVYNYKVQNRDTIY